MRYFCLFACLIHVCYAADIYLDSVSSQSVEEDIQDYQGQLARLSPNVNPSDIENTYQYLGNFWTSNFNPPYHFIRDINKNTIIFVEHGPEDLPLFYMAQILQAKLFLTRIESGPDINQVTRNPLSIIPNNLCGAQRARQFLFIKNQIIGVLKKHFSIPD